jgi:hypothetical protein
MALINGDLVPSSSGIMHLGIDGTAEGVFDHATLAPFGHIHQNSGVFHHAASDGQSGILRFNNDLATPCFEMSVDGGVTYDCVLTGAGSVASVGVIGDTNHTGDVDFATRPSGFMVIEDNGATDPLFWAVDTLGLSGLWGFPAGGFDRVPTCYNETFTSAGS